MDFSMDNKFDNPYFSPFGGSDGVSPFGKTDKVGDVEATGKVDDEKKTDGKSSPQDCETCKNRKYKDGSDESDVSFQTATHIDPSAAGAKVRAHEQEHVSNAYTKAAEAGGKVISVGVSIHTSVCPECGRTYVAGGVTHSVIAYPSDGGGSKIESTNGDPDDAPKPTGSEGVGADTGGKRGGRENFTVDLGVGGSEGASHAGESAAEHAAHSGGEGVRKVRIQERVPETDKAASAGRADNPYMRERSTANLRRASGAIFRARV